MAEILTTHAAAELLGVKTWQVRRLFEDAALPEPERFAGKRVISRRLLPLIAAALRLRGWLPDAEVAHA